MTNTFLTYARETKKVRRIYIVDSEVEGGTCSYFYKKEDEEKILSIIREQEEDLLNVSETSINAATKSHILSRIDGLPTKDDGYITP